MSKMVPLSSLVWINPSTPIPEALSPDAKVAFVPMASVGENGLLTLSQTRPLAEVTTGYTSFIENDVLLAKITPCMENGKAAVAPRLGSPVGFGSTEFHVLRPKPGVDSRFVFHQVWSDRFRTEAAKNMTGSAGQKRVPKAFMERYEVPDYQGEEQERIAAILDKADAIRRKRQQALRLTDDFLRSVFLDMFGDLMTNPLGWPIKPLSEGVVEFEGGRNVMPTETPRADGVRVLKVSAVTSGEYKPDESKSFDQTEEFPAHYIVREGDLLISRANTSELVGAVAYVWKTKGKEMLPDKLWRFIWPEERTIEPLFMLHLARSRYFREQLIQRATGSSGSMKNIGKAKMLEIPIPFPPIDLQRTFSRIAMRSRLASESSVASMKQAETLFSSLQQRAFSGEL